MESKCKYDYMLVTPGDVAYLIKEYRKNRRESIQIIRDIWYGEGNNISPLYRTKLKLFMMDIQFLVNYYEEADREEIKAEIEDTNGTVDRNLFNDNIEIDNYSDLISYFKHMRLLLLYFKNIKIPRKKFSVLINNCNATPEKALSVIKECLKFYSLGICVAQNKSISIDLLTADFKGYITCHVVNSYKSGYDTEIENKINIREIGRLVNCDFSNWTDSDFWAAFR